jgi:hypothetical protein
MTDEHPESPEIEAVRRLLSDARHTEPMPDDVATRLDRALADLAREPGQDTSADVVPLDVEGRRRRRRAAGLLVAAAAVVVGGVVAVPHLTKSSRAASSTSSAGSEAAGGAASADTGARQAPEPRALSAAPGVIVVHGRHLEAAALAGRRKLSALDQHYSMPRAAPARACVRAPAKGTVVRASYRRTPAALVYERPSNGSQKVTLVACGPPSRPIRSVTIPAP